MNGNDDLLHRMAAALAKIQGRHGGVMAFNWWDQADVRAVLDEYDQRHSEISA